MPGTVPSSQKPNSKNAKVANASDAAVANVQRALWVGRGKMIRAIAANPAATCLAKVGCGSGIRANNRVCNGSGTSTSSKVWTEWQAATAYTTSVRMDEHGSHCCA